MATHTPGPWSYDASGGAIYYADGDVEPLIASTNLENVSVEQGDADGLLIAAAPDLLAACQAVLDEFPALDSKRIESIKRICRDAIAKAEGRS